MIRLKLVRVFQAGSFGPIRVYKRARPADAPHPIGDPEETVGNKNDALQDGRIAGLQEGEGGRAKGRGRRAEAEEGERAEGGGAKGRRETAKGRARTGLRRVEGDSRGADLRVAGAADAKGLAKLLDNEPSEDVQAALAG
jgi:hypothetical protein